MYTESCSDLETALSFSPDHSQIKEELSEVRALLEQVNRTSIRYPDDIIFGRKMFQVPLRYYHLLSWTRICVLPSFRRTMSCQKRVAATGTRYVWAISTNKRWPIGAMVDHLLSLLSSLSQAVNQDVSNSWEILGLSDLADCSEPSVVSDIRKLVSGSRQSTMPSL